MSMDKDRLGQAMYDAVHALGAGSGEGDALARMKALAQAIIDEIGNNATIATISTTSTPAGAGPHVHNPATVSSMGKIS